MKICFITSLFAKNYNSADKPINFKINKKYDYYLFTNLDKINFNTSWTIINIDDYFFKDINVNNNIIKSRYPKFMGWYYIKNYLKKDYDIIFYCDCLYYPLFNINWEKYAAEILKCESGIMQQLHGLDPYRECNSIVLNLRDTQENMDKMIFFLKKNNLPNNIKMMENTAFGYNPNNIKITNAMLDFWNTYSKYEITYRDQPYWGYFSWKHNINPIVKEKKHISTLLYEKVQFNNLGFNNHVYIK